MTGPGRGQPVARLSRGATLVELMTSMAILSVLLAMLSLGLSASFGRFRQVSDDSVRRTAADAGIDRIRRDLESAAPPGRIPFGRTPDSITDEQRVFFEGRRLLPFEVDRESGTGEWSSLPNADPAFASLCFPSILESDVQVDPNRDRSAGFGHPLPSIVGYYVAFTRNSPLANDDSRGMKLFRHVRPASRFEGERYAGGFLLHVDRTLNGVRSRGDAGSGEGLPAAGEGALARGVFSNRKLPFLLEKRSAPDMPGDAAAGGPVAGEPAWPLFPLVDRLARPPADLQPERGRPADWETAGHAVHDSLFPDEPICANVVRFEVRPVSRVRTAPGSVERMDAAELNAHLGLSHEPDEWPCLVTPDFLEIEIALVDDATASLLTRYEDWIVDWDEDPTQWSEIRRRIEAGLRTFEFRVRLPTPSAT